MRDYDDYDDYDYEDGGSRLGDRVVTGICTTILVGIATSMAINSANLHSTYQNLDEGYYMKTPVGVPVHAVLGEDKTLDVVIDENFNDKQKASIKNAIEELDIDLSGVNYNILLDPSEANYKCVNIKKDDICEESKNVLGETALKYNMFYGTIVFPVDVTIYAETYEKNFKDADFERDHFKALLKHEMMHVLGFKDTYESEKDGASIMYGGLTENATLFDLSEYDKQMANEAYKPIDNETEAKVEVKQYKPVYFPKIKIDEEELCV